VADVFDYFKPHFPLISMSLNIRDDDLGAIRRIALATENREELLEARVARPKDFWTEVQAMAMHEPQIITSDQSHFFRKLSKL